MQRKILVLIAAAMILLAVPVLAVAESPAGERVLPEGVHPLPIDFSPGIQPDEACYLDEVTYADPSIQVSITSGREQDCAYWIADIKIVDPSQLRTVSAGGFTSDAAMTGPGLARRSKAVLAIDGDFFWYTFHGYILRQGQLYVDQLTGDRDVLLIDENGDFHAVYRPGDGEVSPEIDGIPVVNALFFGPVLVDDGKRVENLTGSGMAEDSGRQRMCLAQTGPLTYKAICCAGPARGSVGMTLEQFADFVAQQGVQTAYNLDGGDSCMMIFHGKKINDISNNSTRKISDIVYFASAYDPEGAAN